MTMGHIETAMILMAFGALLTITVAASIAFLHWRFGTHHHVVIIRDPDDEADGFPTPLAQLASYERSMDG